MGKLVNSTINSSVLVENKEVLVLSKCPPPEFHIMEGFVNHTFFDGLVKLIGYESAMRWPKKLNLVAKDYHGQKFEGNACSKLLKNTEVLASLDILRNRSPLIVLLFLRSFKAMDKLVQACFSTGKVVVDLHPLTNDRVISYMDLNITVPLKVHVLFTHVIPALQFTGGRGLGHVSEQPEESVHREFEQNFWSRFRVLNMESESYDKSLLAAVIDFSSKHI